MEIGRRNFPAVLIGAAALGLPQRRGQAQPGGQQGQGAAGLQNRGAPRGRVGAATRDTRYANGVLTLDLVAPLRGAGLTSREQPALYYLVSGGTVPARRLTISRPRQAQPLADLEFPHPHPAGLGVIRLAEHGVRLAPDTLYVWSVTLALEPGIPSRDLVGSALIEHRPASPALESVLRNAAPERLPFLLAEAGYWYDAVALAERNRASDGGMALSALFRQAELRM